MNSPEPFPCVLTAAQSREMDRRAMEAGIPGLTLMENAGRGCAEWLLTNLKPLSALILCGTGNNGGDGFVIARRLSAAGVEVKAVIFGDTARFSSDAATNFARLTGTNVQLTKWERSFFDPPPDCVVDAVFGTGFRVGKPLEGAFAEIKGWLISREAKLSASFSFICDPKGSAPRCVAAKPEDSVLRCVAAKNPRPVMIAVDLPSGLDADTGEADPACLPADYTLTFVAPKVGMRTENGKRYCGQMVVMDIGVPSEILATVCRESKFERHA